MRKKKAQVTIYFSIFIAMVVIVTIAAVMAPFGVRFNTELFTAGEKMIVKANETAALIQDDDVRAHYFGVFNRATEATNDNVEILGGLFQYAWVIVLVLTALVGFLFTRRLVEFGGGGFV